MNLPTQLPPSPWHKELRQAFRRLDADRNGRVSQAEWARDFRQEGWSAAAAEREARVMVQMTDLNRDGGTSMGELDAHVRRVAEAFAVGFERVLGRIAEGLGKP